MEKSSPPKNQNLSVALHDSLNKLTPQSFNRIILILNAPSCDLPSEHAPQADRSIALISWARGMTGCTLEKLQEVLEQFNQEALEQEAHSIALPIQPTEQVPQRTSLAVLAVSTPQDKAGKPQKQFPSGVVPLNSPYYICRSPDELTWYQSVLNPGSLLRIEAPNLMGKTSLLARILDFAKGQDYRQISLDFRDIPQTSLMESNLLFDWFCERVARKLNIERFNFNNGEDNITKCTNFFEKTIFSCVRDTPLILALDDIDRIFPYPDAPDFLGMLRGWFEKSKKEDDWGNLRQVIVYSTEDVSQFEERSSPLNVGQPAKLKRFTLQQIKELVNLSDLNWSEDQIKEYLEIFLGGHPYLLRVALYYVGNQEIAVKQLTDRSLATDGIYSEHLRNIGKRLSNNPHLHETTLEVMRASEPIRVDRSQVYQLLKIGLVTEHSSGMVEPSCELYRRFFNRY